MGYIVRSRVKYLGLEPRDFKEDGITVSDNPRKSIFNRKLFSFSRVLLFYFSVSSNLVPFS